MTVQLKSYDNSWYSPGASRLRRAVWLLLGQPVLQSSLLPFSALKVFLLRLFGARIGNRVVIKPGVVVKYPWHLEIGDDCWIGERSWIDNLTTVRIAHDTCISQGAYLCTGNHNWSSVTFDLIVAPIHIEAGVWVGAMSFIGPGSFLGQGSVVCAGGVASGVIAANAIFAGNPAHYVRDRTIREPRTNPVSEVSQI